MDQRFIYTFKSRFHDLYYGKMVDHLLAHPSDDDPMSDFARTYTILDCIQDIAIAWDTIDSALIHRCFENLLPPDEYVAAYNAIYNTSEEWTGINYIGFDDDRDLAIRRTQ